MSKEFCVSVSYKLTIEKHLNACNNSLVNHFVLG